MKLGVSDGFERRKLRHDRESVKGERDEPAVRKELGRVRRGGQERSRARACENGPDVGLDPWDRERDGQERPEDHLTEKPASRARRSSSAENERIVVTFSLSATGSALM